MADVTLLDLPVEIMHRIFDYCDTPTIIDFHSLKLSKNVYNRPQLQSVCIHRRVQNLSIPSEGL